MVTKPTPRRSTTRYVTKALREVAGALHIRHRKIGVLAEFFGDIPDRHIGPHVADGAEHRAQRDRRDAERQHVLGAGTQHRIDLGPRGIDRRVQEALRAERPVVVVHRRSVERELEDVAGLDERAGTGAREQEAARIARMAHADVSVFVEHAVIRQDPVSDDQVVDRALQVSPSSNQARMCSWVNATARFMAAIDCGSSGWSLVKWSGAS